MNFTEAMIINLKYGVKVRCKNWAKDRCLDGGFTAHDNRHYADTLDNKQLLNDIENEWELAS